jgi:hypothetical protein
MPRIITSESNKRIKREYRLRFFVALLAACAAAGVLAILFLIPSYALLDSYETAYSVSDSGDAQEEVAQVNEEYTRRLAEVHELSGMIPDPGPGYSRVLDALFSYNDAGLEFDAVELQGTGDTVSVTLRATAQTRADLLTFDEAIRSDDDFSGFKLPIDALTKQSDISFNVTFNYHEK